MMMVKMKKVRKREEKRWHVLHCYVYEHWSFMGVLVCRNLIEPPHQFQLSYVAYLCTLLGAYQ